MPVFPGFLHVMNVDQEGPEVGGMVDLSFPTVPSSMSLRKVGSLPSVAQASMRLRGTPSSPTMSTLVFEPIPASVSTHHRYESGIQSPCRLRKAPPHFPGT